MAAARRDPRAALNRQLQQDCTSFNYYQLVRILARMPVPEGARPPRFRADLSASFPGHEISAVAVEPKSGSLTVRARSYCVAGELGPLPEAYLEWIRQRLRDGDPAMADFIDLFNNRLHWLRYRLKSGVHPGLHTGPAHSFGTYRSLSALAGLADARVQALLGPTWRALVPAAALLMNRRRGGETLAALVSILTGLPARIRQFVGGWRPLPHDQRSRLHETNSLLGRNTVLGDRHWSQEACVEVTLGPMAYADFSRWLPAGSLYRGLMALLQLLTDRELGIRIRMQVEAATLPPSQIMAAPARGGLGLRLGQSAWLHGGPGNGLRDVTFPARR
jgi:type VI secretion system protein ImpH